MTDYPEVIKMLALGLTAGVLSGLFGIGGGLVIVPALVMLFGYPIKLAVGTSLFVILFPTGILGVLENWKAGNIRATTGYWIALGILFGAWIGARYAASVSQATVKKLYAVFLLVATGAIGWEAILRLRDPAPVAGVTVMVVAGIGILINGFTAMLFASGRKDDINIEGAYLHMAADAVVSLGVVVSAALIIWTGWLWLDPLTSLVVVGLIVWGTWSLLRDSLAMSVRTRRRTSLWHQV